MAVVEELEKHNVSDENRSITYDLDASIDMLLVVIKVQWVLAKVPVLPRLHCRVPSAHGTVVISRVGGFLILR